MKHSREAAFRRRSSYPFRGLVLSFWLLAGGAAHVGAADAEPAAPEAVPNADCLQCHADKALTKTNAAGSVVSLFVDEQMLAGSRHATNACVSCHADLGAQHPDDGVSAKPVASPANTTRNTTVRTAKRASLPPLG